MSRGDSGDDSDVDLPVTPAPGTSTLAFGGPLLDAQALRGRRVDAVIRNLQTLAGPCHPAAAAQSWNCLPGSLNGAGAVAAAPAPAPRPGSCRPTAHATAAGGRTSALVTMIRVRLNVQAAAIEPARPSGAHG